MRGPDLNPDGTKARITVGENDFDADEFMYAFRINLAPEEGEAQVEQYFISRRFPKDAENNVRTEQFFRTLQGHQEGLWNEPGQAYIVPSIKSIETLHNMHRYLQGEFDEENKDVMMILRHPDTGAVIDIVRGLLPGLNGDQVNMTYREGMNIFGGELGQASVYRKMVLGKDSNGDPIHPIITYTRLPAVLDYWLNVEDQGQVGDMLTFSLTDGKFEGRVNISSQQT